MFKPEEFGKPISQELSETLREYTSKDDRSDVSTKTGISLSSIRDVMYRNNSLTESNSRAIVMLSAIAKDNCKQVIDDANIAIKIL